MTRTMMTSTNDRLGPYVFAFVAGAIALSTLSQARKAEREEADENAKARAAIADKLIDRFTGLYRARTVRL